MKIPSRKIRIRGNSAFTLIELLVVISIIALLVGILMPSLNEARQHARNVACLATLKGIGLGWQMYWNENDQYLPDVPTMPDNPATQNSIVYVLSPYLPTAQSWKCPSGQGDETYEKYGTSYEFLGGYVVKLDKSLQKAIMRIVNEAPANYPIFADDGEYHPKTGDNKEGKMASYHDGHSEKLDLDPAEKVIEMMQL